jgi:hypothetical protein
LVDIDAGDNTIRPSDAVLSSDEDVAGRWRKINAANAWGAIDYGLSTATLYIDEDGNNLTGEVWTNYSPVEPSENKIAEPYKFDVGWTTFNVTVAADVVQQPSLSANSSADRITASALVSPSNLGYLYRTYSVEQGERRFFAVYVKSTNHTTFKVQFLENDVSKAIETFTISSNWTYIQAYYEVSATSTLKIRIGLIDTPSRSLDLWYAHLGEVTAAIDRVALLLLTNIKTATLHILPWADVENSDWGIGSSVTHNCPAPTRPDLSSSSSMVCSIFKDDSTTIQSNTGDFYPVENTLFRLQVQVRDPNKPPASIGELVLGKATTLGGTEWGVESSILSFSRKERDDTFGTVTFVKRGSARQVRATAFIDTDIISGDTVYHTLASFDGVPVCWDFNNPGSDFDRLRVFGFHTNVRTLIQTNSWESLSIDIEGLVE